MTNIAFLGTGLMGAALAEAAQKRGDQVNAWNRTAAKAEPLSAFGINVKSTAAEAVKGVERVHIMLSDDAAVDDVLAAISADLVGKIVIDHSTVSPAGVVSRAAKLESGGIGFLHAPVFMSPAMCRQAGGIMLCAGPREVYARAESALQAMTGKLDYLGERRDAAAAYKLFGNAMIITFTAGLADVFTMATSLGIEPREAIELFSKFNPAGGIAYRGSNMARGDYTASFELTMARKDVRLMIESVAGQKPLAVLPRIAERMDELLERGHGSDDLGILAIDAIPKK